MYASGRCGGQKFVFIIDFPVAPKLTSMRLYKVGRTFDIIDTFWRKKLKILKKIDFISIFSHFPKFSTRTRFFAFSRTVTLVTMKKYLLEPENKFLLIKTCYRIINNAFHNKIVAPYLP